MLPIIDGASHLGISLQHPRQGHTLSLGMPFTPRLHLRSPLVIFSLSAAFLLLIAFTLLHDSFDSPAVHNALWAPGSVGRGGSAGAGELLAREKVLAALGAGQGSIPEGIQHGGVIMGKLPNATAK